MDTFETFVHQVGSRIRELRQALGISIEGIALRSQVHPSFWSQVERGVKLPSLKSIHRMAAGLRCTPADILTVGKTDPGPVIKREVAALLQERPARELGQLLSVLCEVLVYWDAGSARRPAHSPRQ